MSRPIVVEKLYLDITVPGFSRVCAKVDGELLWYESPDAELVVSPEGFANALLGPAMVMGRDLFFEDPLCATWLRTIPAVVEQYSKWFGWKRIKVRSGSNQAPVAKPGALRALCFSGGVDSFYSLLTYSQPIDTIILVHGYDIQVNDHDGGRFTYDHVKKVAKEKGVTAAMVRTNYREHHLAGRKYRYTYGGGLATIGFLVSGVKELVISSGFRYDEAQPDGSHWTLDPLRSSAEVKIKHYGADLVRDDKLRAIAADPTIRKHLHVCQQNIYGSFDISSEAINCGCCQKCIRTLMVLQQQGDSRDIKGFENTRDLDVHLYKHPMIGKYLFKAYKDIIRRGVDKPTELSIRALLRRSSILNHFRWTGRKGKKALFFLIRIFDALERRIFLYRKNLGKA